MTQPLDKFSATFQGLGLGQLTNDRYQDFLLNGFKNFTPIYHEFIESEIKRLKIRAKSMVDAMRAGVGNDLADLQNQLKDLFELQSRLQDGTGRMLPVLLSNFEIVNGKAILQPAIEEGMKKEFMIVVGTEIQDEVYDRLLKIKKDINSLYEYLDSVGFDVQLSPIVNNEEGFLWINGNMSVDINPQAIEALAQERNFEAVTVG